jgi:hypothetical protein
MTMPPDLRVSEVAKRTGQSPMDVHRWLREHNLSAPQKGQRLEGIFAETYISMFTPVGIVTDYGGSYG